MNIIAVIPARLASTRFPNKPLAKILGIPMIGHVYFRSKMCKDLNEVYVATCDPEIREYMDSVGGQTIMTADTHERASDRTAEAVHKIEKMTKTKIDIVVMIQGDEPMVTPDMISLAIEPLKKDKAILVSNLMAKMNSKMEHEDPNEVKVVVDKYGYALYFSREPIPSRKKGFQDVLMLKQVCVIPFQRDFLMRYNEMEQTPLEKIESVDMNRILENGLKVRMIYTDIMTYSVDTIEDLKKVEDIIKKDYLLHLYKEKLNGN